MMSYSLLHCGQPSDRRCIALPQGFDVCAQLIECSVEPLIEALDPGTTSLHSLQEAQTTCYRIIAAYGSFETTTRQHGSFDESMIVPTFLSRARVLELVLLAISR
jgi:hypothetical protein